MPTHTIQIRGVSVEFPFEPYDCQLVYMERVIESLQDGKHALLESPTGSLIILSFLHPLPLSPSFAMCLSLS